VAVCDKCGLPEDLCVCEEIVKESMRVKITLDKRRFGKYATVIQGLDGKDIDLKELSSLLKAKCACGGTIKDNTIELQGDHKEKVKDLLKTIGYSSELIDVK
jgi:translation initiation factor 1